MNVLQKKLQVETSKEILLQTILKNKENLDTNLIAVAIKNYVKNHENYQLLHWMHRWTDNHPHYIRSSALDSDYLSNV